MRQESDLSNHYCHSPGYIIEPHFPIESHQYNAILCFDTVTILDIASVPCISVLQTEETEAWEQGWQNGWCKVTAYLR